MIVINNLVVLRISVVVVSALLLSNYLIVLCHLFSEIERKIRANDAEFNASFEYAVSTILLSSTHHLSMQ